MKQYLDLLRDVHDNGHWKEQRAVLESTGQRPNVISVFGRQIRFNLRKGFPLVTTRQMNWKTVVGELLWFLSGSTNARELKEKYGVGIWDQWANSSGELGPIYGKQWRRWTNLEWSMGLDMTWCYDDRPFDQIRYLQEGIRAVKENPQHPASRRLLLTSWNPAEKDECWGPMGCHTLAQFYVLRDQLSCHLYQRSGDLFLGVPYNIACYALLTHLLARVTGLEVGEFIHSFGDVHIYENHLDQVKEQLTRVPYPPPWLELDDRIVSMDGIKPEWIKLAGYWCYNRLTGEVAV